MPNNHRGRGQTSSSRRSHRPHPLLLRIATYFALRDATLQTFAREILGGISAFLVSVYMIQLSRIQQTGESQWHAFHNSTVNAAGFTETQFHTLPVSFCLASGVATILVGLVANVPFIIAPGFTFSLDFNRLSVIIGPQGTSAAVLVVGLLLIMFAIASRWARIIMTLPENYRLGISSGVGGLLALVALRSMNILDPFVTSYVTTFSYRTVLAIVGLLLIASMQHDRSRVPWSFLIPIVLITVTSVIVRAAMSIPIVIGEENSVLWPAAAQVPTFATWNATSARNTSEVNFAISKFIVSVYLGKMFDVMTTVAAIILVGVISRRDQPYDKKAFALVLGESNKCIRVYLVDAFCNVLVTPFLGVPTTTPYVESVTAVVVGARTGLASVVAGTCFLLSALFASAISTIIPPEATGPALLVGCFHVIQSLRYIDYDDMTESIPALFAFVLIMSSTGIATGVAYSYVVMCAMWAMSRTTWSRFKPQMIVSLCLCVLFLVINTNLAKTLRDIGIAIVGVIGLGVIVMFARVYYFGWCTGDDCDGSGTSRQPASIPEPQISDNALQQANGGGGGGGGGGTGGTGTATLLRTSNNHRSILTGTLLNLDGTTTYKDTTVVMPPPPLISTVAATESVPPQSILQSTAHPWNVRILEEQLSSSRAEGGGDEVPATAKQNNVLATT